MSGEELGHPKKKSITLQSNSLENGVRALQDHSYSSSDSQERRLREDPWDIVNNRLSTSPSREASGQHSISLLHEGHRSSQNGTPQDALPQARHELNTAASQGSVALPPLSIDTRKVTVESSGVSNFSHIHIHIPKFLLDASRVYRSTLIS